MKKFPFILISIGILFACQQEPDMEERVKDMVVVTNYDTNTNFSAFSTFAIQEDTIGLISNDPDDDTIIVNSSRNEQYPRKIISQIKSNMNAAGYQQVAMADNPDLGVRVFVLKNLNIYQQLVYPAGGFYDPYWGGYYGGGYYYPYVQTSISNQQTLIIEILNLKSTPYKVIWNGYIGDLYTTTDLQNNSLKAIDDAFAQSSYLKTNYHNHE